MKDDGLIGENALTSEECSQVVAEALDSLKAKGVTSAVLAVMIDDGKFQHSRQNYFGGYFTAKGLLRHADELLFTLSDSQRSEAAE